LASNHKKLLNSRKVSENIIFILAENFDRAMKISAGNGSAIVDMRTLIYLACIRRAIGTNTAVIKNIRSTEHN